MPEAGLDHPADFAGWRAAARRLVLAGVPPEAMSWRVGDGPADLLAEPAPIPAEGGGAFSVPRSFMDLAEAVSQHRDPGRFALLYGLLWRLNRGERALMEDALDPVLHRAQLMARAIRRDAHKMKAFVRFREVAGPEGPRYLAWFEPEHHVLDATAPFFARRFSAMPWSILTPERSAHWDGDMLHMAAGASRAEVPSDDALEAYWRTYYASIFNPARLKTAAMRAEMPKKYWKNLPEAVLIAPLVQQAAARSSAMIAAAPTEPARRGRSVSASAPAGDGLAALRRRIEACRDCPLWQPATQPVCGEGPSDARVMLVGEQPGDMEDLAGRPFVGPAGQLLDRALAAAGLDRRGLYLTNAVKHFKFEPRGKRRIHKNPGSGEIRACNQLLTREIALVRPQVIVALGGSAAQALTGRPVKVGALRGRTLPLGDARLVVTVHPSFLLRLPDPAERDRQYAGFVEDLRRSAQESRRELAAAGD